MKCDHFEISGWEGGGPRAFNILCAIGLYSFKYTLCDLGSNINLMSLIVYKLLGLGGPKPTSMRLLIVDRSVKRLVGTLSNVLVKVWSLIFPNDFIILDCEVDSKAPIILGLPFLVVGKALIDMEFSRLNDDQVIFDMCQLMW